VLATFALYAKSVREPTEAEMAVVGMATRIARVVMELRKPLAVQSVP
jgi:hypothetical protein